MSWRPAFHAYMWFPHSRYAENDVRDLCLRSSLCVRLHFPLSLTESEKVACNPTCCSLEHSPLAVCLADVGDEKFVYQQTEIVFWMSKAYLQ